MEQVAILARVLKLDILGSIFFGKIVFEKKMNLEPQNSRRSFPFIFGAKRQSHRPEGGGLGVG